MVLQTSIASAHTDSTARPASDHCMTSPWPSLQSFSPSRRTILPGIRRCIDGRTSSSCRISKPCGPCRPPCESGSDVQLPFDLLALERVYEADSSQTQDALPHRDGHLVETVLMFYPDRVTVCVSCQVGCAVGCAFCATGIGGLAAQPDGRRDGLPGRRLRPARAGARPDADQRRDDGHGRAVSELRRDTEVHPHHQRPGGTRVSAPAGVTISTSGVIPGIDKLADEPSAGQSGRLAPRAERRAAATAGADQPALAGRRAAGRLRRYIRETGRRVSFEYALMSGINSDDESARELASSCAAASATSTSSPSTRSRCCPSNAPAPTTSSASPRSCASPASHNGPLFTRRRNRRRLRPAAGEALLETGGTGLTSRPVL